MNKLCFGAIGLVVYGSLWPFYFLLPDGEPYRQLLETVYRTYSRQDLIENVVLFFPIGFFGLLGARSKEDVPRRLLLVLIGGTVLGLALQIGQIYVPRRYPDLNDAFWNSVGVGLGISLGWLCWRTAPSPYWHRLDMP
ncbi:MAG: VanZ family protein, partial [Geminicoccaceae bacterium]